MSSTPSLSEPTALFGSLIIVVSGLLISSLPESELPPLSDSRDVTVLIESVSLLSLSDPSWLKLQALFENV